MRQVAQSGEEKQSRFEHWFHEYGNAVLHTCFLTLGDRNLAEDAMQETFVKAWNSMERFERRNNSTAKTWLIRIAINTCYDFMRSAWYKNVDMTVALDELPPTLLCVEQESRDTFLDILRLPEKYRQVILIHVYDNLTIRETANVLQVSQVTILRRLKKAFQLLHMTYQKGGENYG